MTTQRNPTPVVAEAHSPFATAFAQCILHVPLSWAVKTDEEEQILSEPAQFTCMTCDDEGALGQVLLTEGSNYLRERLNGYRFIDIYPYATVGEIARQLRESAVFDDDKTATLEHGNPRAPVEWLR